MLIVLTFLVYGFKAALCIHTMLNKYFFMDLSMSWPEAQQYCRQNHHDLATFSSMEDINKLVRPNSREAWIGLSDDPASWKEVMGNDSNSWRWSATLETNGGGYQNWLIGQPNFLSATHLCVSMFYGEWSDDSCDLMLTFVCFTDSKQYILVLIVMKWADAVEYCRQNYVDLAMIEDEADNEAVASVIYGFKVWIGLYRKPWRWSDGSTTNFTRWLPGQPDNAGTVEQCVWENNDHMWIDRNCNDNLAFICQQAFKAKKTHSIKIQLQTGNTLSDAAFFTQTLEQIGENLEYMGLTDFYISWMTLPTKI